MADSRGGHIQEAALDLERAAQSLLAADAQSPAGDQRARKLLSHVQSCAEVARGLADAVGRERGTRPDGSPCVEPQCKGRLGKDRCTGDCPPARHCPDCNGTGRRGADEQCQACGGAGQVEEEPPATCSPEAPDCVRCGGCEGLD